ncbi:MAG: 2Fe-2S iron-sulfur cluster-binding protein [Polyangiales bacterium]
MVKITYVEANGEVHLVQARTGMSLMENAVKNNVPGIAADCGGACACGTCRVYVADEWQEKTGQPSEIELSMIEYIGDTTPGLRLSCQVNVTEDFDGLTVRMPESQH